MIMSLWFRTLVCDFKFPIVDSSIPLVCWIGSTTSSRSGHHNIFVSFLEPPPSPAPSSRRRSNRTGKNERGTSTICKQYICPCNNYRRTDCTPSVHHHYRTDLATPDTPAYGYGHRPHQPQYLYQYQFDRKGEHPRDQQYGCCCCCCCCCCRGHHHRWPRGYRERNTSLRSSFVRIGAPPFIFVFAGIPSWPNETEAAGAAVAMVSNNDASSTLSSSSLCFGVALEYVMIEEGW